MDVWMISMTCIKKHCSFLRIIWKGRYHIPLEILTPAQHPISRHAICLFRPLQSSFEFSGRLNVTASRVMINEQQTELNSCRIEGLSSCSYWSRSLGMVIWKGPGIRHLKRTQSRPSQKDPVSVIWKAPGLGYLKRTRSPNPGDHAKMTNLVDSRHSGGNVNVTE